MTMQNDLYECARRKCRHRYKHNESVYVPRESRPGQKTLPSFTGTCPKCGHDQFYIVKAKKSPNDELKNAGPRTPDVRES